VQLDAGINIQTFADVGIKKVADNTKITINEALQPEKTYITASFNIKDWVENIEFIARSEYTGDFYVGGWNGIMSDNFISLTSRTSSVKDLAP
jgi:hypothetical protein